MPQHGLGQIAQGAHILYWLITTLPMLALTSRRLHDTGRSAAWILLPFIGGVALGIDKTAGPIVQIVVLLVALCTFVVGFVFTVQDSQPGPNRYGPNPKGINSVSLEAT